MWFDNGLSRKVGTWDSMRMSMTVVKEVEEPNIINT
jgi:hypothetical protein